MIDDPPLLTMQHRWARPARSVLGALAGAQTGHIVDALGGRAAMRADLRPLDAGTASFVGAALTCEPFADDNLAIFAALALAQPGDVLVCQADGFGRTAVVGDNVALMARNAGVHAIVVDGMARDLEGLLAVGLPVFVRGITPNSCVRNGPGRVGLPIVCGGVAVRSGDVVVGDRDGVVVIPAADLNAVVAQLDGIRLAEAALQARIKQGLVTLDAVRVLIASDRVRWVEEVPPLL